MKSRLITTVFLLAATLLFHDAFAKDLNNEKETSYQHSLELTTGYPSLIFDLEFPTLSSKMQHYRPYGQDIVTHYTPGLNIGYTFGWSKRWEVNAMANMHLTSYDIVQYPSLSDTEGNGPSPDNYDWDAEPVSKTRESSVNWAICASVRYKWLVRDAFNMYSALGAGISIASPIPLPYIAPVGIQFGKGRVYGIAEVNISAANTFGMAGIGIKLN